jgi:hypothetical protein
MLAAIGAAWIMLLPANGAFAQSTQTSGKVTWADSDSGAQVCDFNQQTKGSCSGAWAISWAKGTGTISGVARYGVLRGNAVSKTTVTSQSIQDIYTNSEVNSSFSDVLSFPTLPSGMSAVLTATVDLSGGSFVGSPPSKALGEAVVYLGNNGSQCSVEGSGTCTASLSWVGGSGSANIQVTMTLLALADAPCCYAYEYQMAEDQYYLAKVTALTLTGADGKRYKIVAASGHYYPG